MTPQSEIVRIGDVGDGDSNSNNSTCCTENVSTTTASSTELCVHCWNEMPDAKALVVVYHGFLAHGRYPTVVYAAEKLASAGYMVIAADLPGHGRSPGLRGLLPSAHDVIRIGASIAEYAKRRFNDRTNTNGNDKDDQTNRKKTKLFLVGSSMGGTIALSVARKMSENGSGSDGEGSSSSKNDVVSGVALLAPMLKLSVGSIERYLLWGLSAVAASWEVIPSSSSDSSKQYRDPDKRRECDEDEYTAANKTTKKIRIGSASTCVDLAADISEEFSNVDFPILVMIGDEDVVVKNEGSLELMEKAASSDKTLKRYAALHGLLCEPSPLVDEIENDLVAWMDARADTT